MWQNLVENVKPDETKQALLAIYCLHEVQQRQMLSLYLRKNNPMHLYMFGVNQLESCFAEKDVRDSKWNLSQ